MANKQRLIDANALKSEFEWLKSVVNESSKDKVMDVMQRIDNAPTVDAVEVVRCVECDHLRSGRNNFGVFFWCGNAAGLTNIYDPYKDYCPRGERRDKDGEND